MEHLGIGARAGRRRGAGFLLEIRLDEGLIGEDEAMGRLDAWWAARQP